MKMIRDIISHHKIFICIALCVCVCVKLKNPFGNQPPIRQIVKLFRIFSKLYIPKSICLKNWTKHQMIFFFKWLHLQHM